MEIHDFAFVFLDELGLLQKPAVILVRHEADLHALLLVRGLEIAMAGDFAGVALGLFAEGKHGAGELLLS